MLLRTYLPKIMTALFGGLFIAAGILTFNDSFIFDRLFIGVLIFTVVFCRHNINVVGVILIIFIFRALEELAWVFLEDTVTTKLFLYLFCFYIAYRLRYDWLAKLFLTLTALVSSVEIYWYFANYSAPEIYWYMALGAATLTARNLVFSRVSITELYFPKFKNVKSINLDWTIYKLYAFSMLVQTAVILEYLIRHLFNKSQFVLLYYSNSYIVHGIAVLGIWAIFHESYKQLLPKLLKA
ncbi:MAG: hypothetical protein ACJA13_002806 [Paraglaciecola sp.]|jgi:hypothetical protein